MKTINVIKIQSFTDVITNSSSELFVLNPEDQNVSLIEEILKMQLEVLKKITPTFEFDELNDLLYIEVAATDYDSGDLSYGEKWKKGDILIHSQSDNTIPYIMMQLIEEMSWRTGFKRYHLG